MDKWNVLITEEADRELAKAVRENPDLKPDILLRLGLLADYPPEKWFFISRHKGLDLFRAETGQMIRISGQADPGTRTVHITHIRVIRRAR